MRNYRVRLAMGGTKDEVARAAEEARREIAAIQARARARGGMQGLGDVSLAVAAVVDPFIRQTDAQLADLRANWHPTGFYTPAQILRVADSFARVQAQFISFLDAYIQNAETGEAGAVVIFGASALALSRGTLAAKTARSLAIYSMTSLTKYIEAARTGTQQGKKYVDAPGFRTAVLETYAKLGLAAKAIRGLTAGASWITELVTDVGVMFVAAAVVIKAIVGVAIQVATAAVDALIKVPDTLGTILKILKFALPVGGGLYVYDQVQKKRGKKGIW